MGVKPDLRLKKDVHNFCLKSLRVTAAKEDHPVIYTQRLILRPLHMRDARDFYAYAKDPRVAEYVFWEPHENLGQTRSILRSLIAQSKQEQLYTKAIISKDSQRMIGTIGLVTRDTENQTAEVGFSLCALHWGQGLMSEALSAYLRYLFFLPGLNRIEAQHDVLNPASGAVMENAGMHKEGVLRERIYYKKRYASVVLYSALKAQWMKEQSETTGFD